MQVCFRREFQLLSQKLGWGGRKSFERGLGKNLEDDGAFASLEDVDGFLVGEAFERDAVDREDLVASLEFPVF